MTMDAIRPNSGDTPPLAPQPDARPGPRFSIAGKTMAGKGAQWTTRISEALIPKPRQRTTSLPTPVDATAYLRDVIVPGPAPACGERRADMPETDLHTAEGQLRRDVAIKVLERIEHRLAQLAEETAKPRVNLAAQRQRRAIWGMLQHLHERGGAERSPTAPETAATPVSAGRHSASPTLSTPSTSSTQLPPADTGSTDVGLDISDSAKLVQVLRETRKAVCSRPSPLVRFWQLLFPRPWKKAAEHQPDALLDMLLKHFDVQVLGGWAALERGRIEACLKESYAKYARAGESRSTFLGGVGTVPVGVLLPGVSAGVVVGATILGRDLVACEDGDIEQSKWWSGTLGGALMAHFGVIAGKLSLTGTATRKEGVFFNDVDHLLASRQGLAHHDVVNGPRSGRFKQAMGRMRFTRRTNLTLANLDAMQEKAYAQRDIFAKVVGPVSMPSADGEEALHMVGVHSRAPDAPLPCDFTSTESKVTAAADAQAGVSSVLAANLTLTAGYARMGLTVRPRVDFWRAVQDGSDDIQADSPKDRAARDRAAELRAVGARIEPALAHLRSVPAAMAARNAADEPFRIETATASELSNVLTDMNHEFDRYCYARRQIHDGMPRHARQARAIESSWGVKESGQAVYAYVQRLRIIHALIGLRLQALGHGGEAQFEKFGRKLDAPDMTVYAPDKAKPHISFIDERDLVERSTPIALKAGVSLLGEKSQLSVSAGLSVSARAEVRERSDWNILRDGNYLDVSFDINLDASLTLHIPAIGESLLDKASALGLDQGLLGKGIEQAGKALKEMLVLSPQGSLARRVTLRYHQPRGANGLDKMRLQHLRITRLHSGPIHQKSHLLVEKLGVDTLSYMFVRHHAFFDNKGEAGKRHWDNFCALHPEELHQMLTGLGRRGSKIRAEGERYWDQTLDRAADEAARRRLLAERDEFFEVMSRYAGSQETDGQPWEDGKFDRAAYQDARSALDAFAAAHMAPWRHGRDQHTRRNARIKLLD